LASEGYRSNEVVYACVREIASTAAEVALRVVDNNNEPLPDHPLQQLLDHPNPEHSPFELIEALLTDLLVYGNAFLLKERDPLARSAPRAPDTGATAHPGSPFAAGRSELTNDTVSALWKLRPDRIRIVPGSRRLVRTYIHRVGERETQLAPRDVIHFRLPDPTNDLWGLSPIQVAARQIDTDNEASKFVDAFFRNAAVPFGIIKLKRTLRGGEPEARRIGQRWTDRFRGLLGRFQIGVLDADAEFQRIGLTQEEMAFPELRAQTEARICAAFRVPPVLVGVKVGLDRSTFSNMAEARRFFWENTMLSLYRRVESKYAASLTPEFSGPGESVRVRFDFSAVAALKSIDPAPTQRSGVKS
jgi:HK97 family phage portal protein